MRILFVTEQFPYPLHDGGNLRTYHIIRALASRHQVSMISHRPGRDPEGAAEALRELCDVYSARSPRIAERLLFAPVKHLKSLFLLKNWSRPLLREMDRLLLTGGVDAIHFNHLDTACYALLRNWPQLKVFDTHNCLSAMAEQVRCRGTGQRRLFYAWEAGRLRHAEHAATGRMDINLVCSEEDARKFRDVNPSALYAVVPNGVDTEYFSAPPDVQEEPGTLVFTGAMNYYPNEQAAVFFCREVMPLLSGLKLKVYFVGMKPSATVSALHNGRTVHVTGRVEDIRPYVARAQVCIVPLRHGSGTRLKILEAFSMGKAVVSTSLGAEGIHAENGRHIRLADEPEAFAECVRSLLDDSQARRGLGLEARRLVLEHYDWKRIQDSVLNLYDGLAGERPVAARPGDAGADRERCR